MDDGDNDIIENQELIEINEPYDTKNDFTYKNVSNTKAEKISSQKNNNIHKN